MKPSSDEILKVLNDARGKTPHDGWIIHSICVGEVCARLANALNEKGFDLDVDKARTLGLLHDIGKITGKFNNHVMGGYKYMKEKGYNEEYCNIALTHSYLNNDYLCTAAGIPDDIPFRTEFIKNHEYTLYDKMVNLGDLMCAKKIFTVDKRLVNIVIRRGAYFNTQYHMIETYKLKEYFDNLLGYNLYKLFPEINDSL